MTLRLDPPWLVMPLGAPHRVLSWCLTRPGYVTADHILWREVRNADLAEGFDVTRWLSQEMVRYGLPEAVTLLTSRNLAAFEVHESTVEDVTARCVATVGLSNAERIGFRVDRSGKDWGTINIAVQVSQPLSDAGLLETLSLATQARTAAVIETQHALSTGIATGTGTDCIAIAGPLGGNTDFAGLHTATGEAVGQAVYTAVRQGADVWMRSVRRADTL